MDEQALVGGLQLGRLRGQFAVGRFQFRNAHQCRFQKIGDCFQEPLPLAPELLGPGRHRRRARDPQERLAGFLAGCGGLLQPPRLRAQFLSGHARHPAGSAGGSASTAARRRG